MISPAQYDSIRRRLLCIESLRDYYAPDDQGNGESTAFATRVTQAKQLRERDLKITCELLRTAEQLASGSRQKLQAHNFLRESCDVGGGNTGGLVMGVVVEFGQDAGTDAIAVYEDGTANWLSHADGVKEISIRQEPALTLVSELMTAARNVAVDTKPLLEEFPAAPGPGFMIMAILTTGGVHVGLGLARDLAQDKLGQKVLLKALELRARIVAGTAS